MKTNRLIILLLYMILPIASSYAGTAALARGRMAYEDGFLSQAASAFEGILVDPAVSSLVRSEAADFLLRTHYAQNDFDRIALFLADPARGGLLDGTSRAYWHAMLAHREGDWPAVLAGLDRLPVAAAEASARVLRLRASAYLQLGRLGEAAVLYERLATAFPDAGQAALDRLNWGRVLQSDGRFAAAIPVWEPLLVLTNQHPQVAMQARYLIGQGYMQEKSFALAEDMLAPLALQVRQGDMLSVAALISQAASRQMRGDLEGAVALLRGGIEALGTHSLRRRLQIELGRTLLSGGALEEGKQAILQFASQNADSPEAPDLLLELARRLFEGKRYEDAMSIYQRYLEAFGDRNGVASHGRGLALSGAGRHGEAALAFELAYANAREGTRKEESLMLAAQARYANKQYRQAIERLDEYLARYPAGRFLHMASYERANAFAALDDLPTAVGAFGALAGDVAGDVLAEKALLRIGELYLARERWEEAEAAFASLLTRYPVTALSMQGLHGRGVARFQLRRDDAMADLARVAVEAEDSSLREHARFMQAVMHFRLGQDEQAMALCKELLQDAPDSVWAPDVQFRLAQFAFNAGQYEAAEQAFLAFVAKYPEHENVPQSRLRAGLAAIRRHHFVGAIEILGLLAEQYPAHALLPYARFHQAESLVQLGRHATAILMYQEVIRLAPNTELAYAAWSREGDSHFALGSEDPTRFDAAANAYQVVLQAAGIRLHDRLQAAYKLGLTYEKMGRTAVALDQYYEGVILPFHLGLQEKGEDIGVEGRVWYARAVRGAGSILERQQEWRRLVRILDRAAGTDTDVAVEASRRARALRSEYWWLFY